MTTDHPVPEPVLAAVLRLPLLAFGVLIRRAQARDLPRHANALAELAQAVQETGVPQVMSPVQRGRAA